MTKKKGLGAGVGALFGEETETYFECKIEDIHPNKHQPRSEFDEERLAELSASIQQNGIIQPLIVKTSEEGGYQLIAGERRLRASKLAGLQVVPVVVRDVENDDSLLELALIENVQRTDLNPLEEAQAYRKLIDRFGYTQEKTATKVGKKRSTITNLLRLLKLPPAIQEDISQGRLSEGHGRALVKMVNDPEALQEVRDQVIDKGLSVRQTEGLVRAFSSKKHLYRESSKSRQNREAIPGSYARALTNRLTNHLHSRVVIAQNGNRGKIEIEYYSPDDLERVISKILGE